MWRHLLLQMIASLQKPLQKPILRCKQCFVSAISPDLTLWLAIPGVVRFIGSRM